MKQFYLILANSFVAMIASLTLWFALIYYVYLQTHSVFVTSMLAGAYLVATASTGIWFGSLIDHHHKKQVMLGGSIGSLISFLIATGIYALLPSTTWQQVSNPWLWIWIVTVLVGVIAGNIRGIALPTLVTLFVPKEGRDKANGLSGMVNGVGYMVTSVISGFLVAKTGMWGALGGGVGLTALTIVHLLFQSFPEHRIVHLSGSKPKIDMKNTLHVIRGIPGLLPLILFSTCNNFLGGVFMSLMDAYGLSMMSVQNWGTMWGVLGISFVFGGMAIHKFGLGKSPVASLMKANLAIWIFSALFTVVPSIWTLAIGGFLYMAVFPYIEAAEQTIFQNLVPHSHQGRVFGFAQTVEQSASPITSFLIGPITQFVVIPFMTTGWGATHWGSVWGVGEARGMALVFTTAGVLGMIVTFLAWRSRYYRTLHHNYHQVVVANNHKAE